MEYQEILLFKELREEAIEKTMEMISFIVNQKKGFSSMDRLIPKESIWNIAMVLIGAHKI